MRNSAHNSLAACGRRGQAGLFVVIILTLLFSVLGLTVDVGWAYYKRHAAQSAADAAALAASVWASQNSMACGAGGLVCGVVTSCAYPNVTSPLTNPLQVACLYAQANGFVNNGNQTVSAQVNNTTPPGVTGNNPLLWVQVNVSESPTTLFGNFAGMHSFRVNAQSTAGITGKPAANAIIILSPSASPALNVSGGASLTVSGGGVYVNSSDSDALNLSGSATLTAATINVNGGYKPTSGGPFFFPAPTTGAAVVPDPLSGIGVPSYTGCDHISYTAADGDVLTHGNYCGGITVNGTAHITVKAGNYILNGGGLTISNGGSLTSVAADDGTTGVTFFNTGSASYASRPLTISGSGILTASAPAYGTYRGLVWYEDPNAGVSFNGQNTVSNSGQLNVTGTVYCPRLELKISGAATLGTNASIVALMLDLSGSATLTNDTTGTKSALGSLSSSLIN